MPLLGYVTRVLSSYQTVLAINQTVTYGYHMSNPPPVELADTDTEIASRISNALIIRNVTMQSLSEKTGIAYPTLRRSLRGFRSLTFKEFTRISTALELKPMALLPDSFGGDTQ